jgi:hypothetical protein
LFLAFWIGAVRREKLGLFGAIGDFFFGVVAFGQFYLQQSFLILSVFL